MTTLTQFLETVNKVVVTEATAFTPIGDLDSLDRLEICLQFEDNDVWENVSWTDCTTLGDVYANYAKIATA